MRQSCSKTIIIRYERMAIGASANFFYLRARYGAGLSCDSCRERVCEHTSIHQHRLYRPCQRRGANNFHFWLIQAPWSLVSPPSSSSYHVRTVHSTHTVDNQLGSTWSCFHRSRQATAKLSQQELVHAAAWSGCRSLVRVLHCVLLLFHRVPRAPCALGPLQLQLNATVYGRYRHDRIHTALWLVYIVNVRTKLPRNRRIDVRLFDEVSARNGVIRSGTSAATKEDGVDVVCPAFSV